MRIDALCLVCLASGLLSGCLVIGDISELTDDTLPAGGEPRQEISYCIADRQHRCSAASTGSSSQKPGANVPLLAVAVSGSSVPYLGKEAFTKLLSEATKKTKFDPQSVIPKSLQKAGTRFTDPTDSEYASYVRADNFLRNNAVQQDIVAAIAFAAGLPAKADRTADDPSTQTSLIKLDRKAAMGWASDLYETAADDGFALAEYVNYVRADSFRENGDTQNMNTFIVAARTSGILKTYIRAFFRNGKFASIRLNAGDLEKEIRDKLNATIPNDVKDRDKLIDDLTAKMLRSAFGGDPDDGALYTLVGEISDAAFVSRGGVSYSFPAITVDVNPLGSNRIDTNEVDYTAVGANLVRVAIEALGDAYLNVPADASSTARKQDRPFLPPVAKAEEKVFTKTNDIADKADGLAGATAGRFIRGISWFSLNNEALAVLIETSLAVIARKGAEKIAWCYFKCSAIAKSASDFDDLEIRYKKSRALRLKIAAPRTD